MSEMKLFRLSDDQVHELTPSPFKIEKLLQNLIERHLETFLGVRFLASELSTSTSYGGRVDTLGIDNLGCPVVIEYKRAMDDNVVNQALHYLSWLKEHKADFQLLVMKRLASSAVKINWANPRLICVAAKFNKFDISAANAYSNRIDLVRYRRFGDELILLESVVGQLYVSQDGQKYAPVDAHPPENLHNEVLSTGNQDQNELSFLSKYPNRLRDWYAMLKTETMGLGHDIYRNPKPKSGYIGFWRNKKVFAYVNFRQQGIIFVDVPLADPRPVPEPGFLELRDDWGVRLIIDSDDDIARALPTIEKAYQLS